jgi:pimeloyl-ACP methyl ester carboxylesterase
VADPAIATVDFDGFPIRVWTKGSGPKIGFIPGLGGLPRWIPFLDKLAETRTVIVPSLPGFPGGDKAHTVIDSHLDWIVALRRIVVAAGLDGADLIGSSIGGALTAELAALWPQSVRRLALIAPFGMFKVDDPTTSPFAQKPDDIPGLMVANPDIWVKLKAEPAGANSVEWSLEQTRAGEAAARIYWPLGDTRLARRLPLIEAPTLLLWGEKDRMVPRSYAKYFAAAMTAKTELKVIPGAGHLAELDAPDAVAAAVRGWSERS